MIQSGCLATCNRWPLAARSRLVMMPPRPPSIAPYFSQASWTMGGEKDGAHPTPSSISRMTD